MHGLAKQVAENRQNNEKEWTPPQVKHITEAVDEGSWGGQKNETTREGDTLKETQTQHTDTLKSANAHMCIRSFAHSFPVGSHDHSVRAMQQAGSGQNRCRTQKLAHCCKCLWRLFNEHVRCIQCPTFEPIWAYLLPRTELDEHTASCHDDAIFIVSTWTVSPKTIHGIEAVLTTTQ